MYKVELTSEELIWLAVNLKNGHVIDEEKELKNKIYEKLKNAEIHYVSINKKLATQKATKVRSERAKDKINNAINLLQFENKPITHYSIAQTSGVSFNTVKKHIPDIDKIGKL